MKVIKKKFELLTDRLMDNVIYRGVPFLKILGIRWLAFLFHLTLIRRDEPGHYTKGDTKDHYRAEPGRPYIDTWIKPNLGVLCNNLMI